MNHQHVITQTYRVPKAGYGLYGWVRLGEWVHAAPTRIPRVSYTAARIRARRSGQLELVPVIGTRPRTKRRQRRKQKAQVN